jgi:hypothetical protein
MQITPVRFILTAFIGLVLVVSSCTRPDQSIGLELQPEGDLLSASQTDTISLTAFTIPEDSLRSDELSLSLLGNYVDPLLGYTSASFYTQIRISANSLDFGDLSNIEVDSLVLNLVYGGESYGINSDQVYQVYEVDEDIIIDTSYYTSSSVTIKQQNLAANSNPVHFDVNDYIQLANDSVPPSIRIHLDPSWATDFFLPESGGDNLEDNTAWIDFFKGIYVRSNTPNASVMSIDVRNSFSNLTMYYRDMNGATADTTEFQFLINDLCARFNHIDHLYGGNISALEVQDAVDADPYVYVQAGASVKTRISFPYLEDLTNVDGLVVNAAELIVPAQPDLFGHYNNQEKLFLRLREDDGDPLLLPDEVTFNFSIGGEYDEETHDYRFKIPRFIQQVLSGEIENQSIYLVSNLSGISVRRVVLSGPSVSDSDSSQNMRLILTHTRSAL